MINLKTNRKTINKTKMRKLNTSILTSFLKYAIEETGRISGDHDGIAGLTMIDDSYKDIADDFIFRTRNDINNKISTIEWVSVKDKLPEASEISIHFSKAVIVTDGSFIGTGFVIYEYGEWTCVVPGYIESRGRNITYWANMPNIPEKY